MFLKFLGGLSLVSVVTVTPFSQTAFAMPLMIGSDVQPNGPESVCSLRGTDLKSGKTAYDCSSTLVSPTEIVTAAHCLDDLRSGKFGLEIRCGYGGIDKSSVRTEEQPDGLYNYISGVIFKEKMDIKDAYVNPKHKDEDRLSSGDDIGIIHLATASKLTPSNMFSPSQVKATFFAKDGGEGTGQCFASGYGLNNDGGGGILNSSSTITHHLYLKDGVISGSKEIPITDEGEMRDLGKIFSVGPYINSDGWISYVGYYLKTKKLLDFADISGDSGGPLFCRENPTAPWKIVGLFSTFGFLPNVTGTRSAPVFNIDVNTNWNTLNIESATEKIWTSPKK